MREYELAVVYDLAVAEAGGAEASIQHLTQLVETRGGQVLRVDHWGRRRMAYPIGRAIDGDYVISRIELDPAGVDALEATLRIDERVYRHLIVRADELPVPPPPREPRQPVSVQESSVATAPVAEAPAAVAEATPEPEVVSAAASEPAHSEPAEPEAAAEEPSA
jgi:small subunit ribosomal protein S6